MKDFENNKLKDELADVNNRLNNLRDNSTSKAHMKDLLEENKDLADKLKLKNIDYENATNNNNQIMSELEQEKKENSNL